MKTTQEKLRAVYKECDKIIDEYDFGDAYSAGEYDIAKKILALIEEE